MPCHTFKYKVKKNKTEKQEKISKTKILRIKQKTVLELARYDTSTSSTHGGALMRSAWDQVPDKRPPPTPVFFFIGCSRFHRICFPRRVHRHHHYFFCSFLPFLRTSLFLMCPRFLLAVWLEGEKEENQATNHPTKIIFYLEWHKWI